MEAEHWSDLAACHKHLLLPWDAWFELKAGRPRGDGIKALMVCRFACPVRRQCQEVKMGANVIHGGGWTDRNGRFINPGDGALLDVAQAAVYLGTSQGRFAQHAKRRHLPPAMVMGGRTLYDVDVVSDLLPTLSPAHGTVAAKERHILHGQPQCTLCLKVAG